MRAEVLATCPGEKKIPGSIESPRTGKCPRKERTQAINGSAWRQGRWRKEDTIAGEPRTYCQPAAESANRAWQKVGTEEGKGASRSILNISVGWGEGRRGGSPSAGGIDGHLVDKSQNIFSLKTRKGQGNVSGRQHIVELPEWEGKKRNDQHLLSIVPSFPLSFFNSKNLLLWKLLNTPDKRGNSSWSLCGTKARVHYSFFFF